MFDYSILVPFRDTERERKFAKKSIPSFLRLNPKEILIGIDNDASSEFVSFIAQFDDPRIQLVRCPPADNFELNLANVLHQLILNARTEKLLTCWIDTKLYKQSEAIISQYNKDGHLMPLVHNLNKRHIIRYLHQKHLLRKMKNVYCGMLLLPRAEYLQYVDESELRSIRNGIDVYIQNVFNKFDAITYTKHEPIGTCMDIENPDLPWRQFEWGVWHFVHTQNRKFPHLEKLKSPRMRNILLSIRALYGVVKIAVLREHPYIILGYWFALRHPEHPSVRLAKGLTYRDYSSIDNKIRETRDWSKNRMGTGF